MIMTQNQILLSEARFGFRYASDRVPKQRNAIPRFLFRAQLSSTCQSGSWMPQGLAMGRNSTEIAHPQRLASTSD